MDLPTPPTPRRMPPAEPISPATTQLDDLGFSAEDQHGLSPLVRQFMTARKNRQAVEKQAKALLETEKALKERLINGFREHDLEGLLVEGRSIGLNTKTVAILRDAEAFQQYVMDNHAWGLVSLRLSTKAIEELLDAGLALPPGVGFIDHTDLFDHKV